MPRYRVKGPDGRPFIVNAPDGASKEQVLAYARQHAPRARPSSGIGALDSALSTLNEVAIGVPQGIYNAAAFFTDPLMALIVGKDKVRAAQQQRQRFVDAVSRTIVSRPNPTARAAGQIGGAMLLPVPKIPGGGALVTTANRAVQGAMGGAAVRDSDESAVPGTITGAVANVVLPPLASKIAQSPIGQAAGRALAPIVRPIVNAADDAAETIVGRVAPKLGYSPAPLRTLPPPPPPEALEGLGRKAAARAARLKSLGVDNPTTGMVTRDPNIYSFERNTAKLTGTGDDLQRQIRNVEETLVERGRELVRAQGGAQGTEETGTAVQRALDTKRAEMQQVTSGIYKATREARGDVAAGPLNGLRDALDDPSLTDNPVFDTMRQGVLRRLQRFGMAGESGLLRNESVATIGQAEELRKFIGGLGDVRDPATRMMRAKLIDALDDDVVGAVGDDAFKAARESAKARFQEFSKTFSGRIADEGIAPERLTRRILSDTTSLKDLRALKQSLMTGTDEQMARGAEALQGLRGQALDDLLSGSTNQDNQLLGGKLARDFSKSAGKFRELLDPADYKTLSRLVQASRDVTVFPPGHSVNVSNTAITARNMFDTTPAHVRDGWLKFMGKLGLRAGASIGASAAIGPAGIIAAESARATGSAAMAGVAERKAAQALMSKIKMAQNPEEYAAAVRAAKGAAQSSPAMANLFDKWGLAGYGAARGGTAAAATK